MPDHLIPRRRDQWTVAALLVGMLVFVLLTGENAKVGHGSVKKSYRYRVDLNSALSPELRTLPGIGEKLAEGILLYREENGPFRTHEEVINVKGIGPKKREALKPYLLEIRTERQAHPRSGNFR